eukprot:scaffold10205_cov215-Skeletonema_marinoi.AAC.13
MKGWDKIVPVQVGPAGLLADDVDDDIMRLPIAAEEVVRSKKEFNRNTQQAAIRIDEGIWYLGSAVTVSATGKKITQLGPTPTMVKW